MKRFNKCFTGLLAVVSLVIVFAACDDGDSEGFYASAEDEHAGLRYGYRANASEQAVASDLKAISSTEQDVPVRSAVSGSLQQAQFKRFWFKKYDAVYFPYNSTVTRDVEGLIYQTGANAYTVYCPAQSNITYNGGSLQDGRQGLRASFETWDSGADVEVNDIDQYSGVTVNDFNANVVYTVEYGGVTNTYTVVMNGVADGNILKYASVRPYAMNPEHGSGYSLSLTVGNGDTDNIKPPAGFVIMGVQFDTDNNGTYDTTDTSSPYEASISSSLCGSVNAGKIYEFKIKVTYRYGNRFIYPVYSKRISVAEKISNLPSPVDGYFTCFDFYYDGSGNRQFIALNGADVSLYDTSWYTAGEADIGMDPAFIKVLRDNDSILLGAGAGGFGMADNGEALWDLIGNLGSPSYTIGVDGGGPAGDVDWHFAADIWDYNYTMGSSGTHDWIALNHGDTQWDDAYVKLVQWDDWSNGETVVDIPDSPSCGLWTSAAGDLYMGACSTAYGTMGGQVYKIEKSNILAAFNSSPYTAGEDSEVVLIYSDDGSDEDDDEYTQYSVLGDNMGNIFVTGGSWGEATTALGGYFEIGSSVADYTKPILAGTDFGYVSLGTVSYDKRYIGWVSFVSSAYNAWVIPLCGSPE